MKGLRAWAMYGVLLALAGAVAVGTGAAEGSDSPTPSVENPGRLGVRALYVYLTESGRPVRAWKESLRKLPPDVRTLVIAAPKARRIEQDEVAALKTFVERGGTLVYLSPRPVSLQPHMAQWLGLDDGPAVLPHPLDGRLRDLGGFTAEARVRAGAMRNVERLRVSAATTVQAEGALPVADGGVLWWKRLGAGEVYIGAGADLSQNERLELLDNLQLWENLAQAGMLAFDELHHEAESAPPVSGPLWAVALQFLAVFAMFALSRGTRLGPARAELEDRHRSTREYLDSMARLTRRAKVERELASAQVQRLRVLMQDRLGISRSLPDTDAAPELERHTHIPASRTMAVLASAKTPGPMSEKEYVRFARQLADLERVLTGRRAE